MKICAFILQRTPDYSTDAGRCNIAELIPNFASRKKIRVLFCISISINRTRYRQYWNWNTRRISGVINTFIFKTPRSEVMRICSWTKSIKKDIQIDELGQSKTLFYCIIDLHIVKYRKSQLEPWILIQL